MMPKPPKSLGPAGRELWRAVLASFELSPPELAILGLACEARDDAASSRTALRAEGLTLEGRYGPRVHPAVAIARQAEVNVSRLLGQLGAIDRDPVSGRTASTPGPKPRR